MRTDVLNELRKHLLLGPGGNAYRWFVWGWLLAVLARMTLLDATQDNWLLPNLLLLASAFALIKWGGRVFWFFSVIALVIPLLWLGDWLTQTVVMALIAAVGTLTVHSKSQRGRPVVTVVAYWLVISVYLIAAFHKLNLGFFNVELSCANETISQLSVLFPGWIPGPWLHNEIIPVLAILFELTIAFFLVLKHRYGIALGLAFHIPLTLVLAPSFVFVVGIGYVAALDEMDRKFIISFIKARNRWLVTTSILISAVLFGLSDASSTTWDLWIKLVLLVFFLIISTFLAISPTAEAEAGLSLPLKSNEKRILVITVTLFTLNCMTPYLGTQFQHTGAMLSNLRVDNGCWNHLFVPETVSQGDNYIRFETALLGSDEAGTTGLFPETETLLTERLWSVAALRKMRRNWCTERTRPIQLTGTQGVHAIEIEDLCDLREELPMPRGVWGGRAWFPDYLRYQKRLPRECEMQCIH